MKKIIISILLVFVLGLSLTSAAVGDVTVTFSDTEETGNPADTVSYTLSLENSGLNESTISFTSTVLTDASSNNSIATSFIFAGSAKNWNNVAGDGTSFNDSFNTSSLAE